MRIHDVRAYLPRLSITCSVSSLVGMIVVVAASLHRSTTGGMRRWDDTGAAFSIFILCGAVGGIAGGIISRTVRSSGNKELSNLAILIAILSLILGLLLPAS